MINSDRAYLLGLMVGGGRIIDRKMIIKFPLKEWGDHTKNIERGAQLANDFAQGLVNSFRASFEVMISYEVNPWRVQFDLPIHMMQFLESVGLPKAGEFREIADVSKLVTLLNTFGKKRFLAGLADVIGSVEQSHRRFHDGFPIVSFEFIQFNYKLVRDIANIFFELGTSPDQILWNHPNLHSGLDRYYQSWKKGTKLRVPLVDFMKENSFKFASKADSAFQNLTRSGENRGQRKPRNDSRSKSLKALHIEQDSKLLPEVVRNLIILHGEHLSAMLGCARPESLDFVDELIVNGVEQITPFTRRTKATWEQCSAFIERDPILQGHTFSRKIQIDLEKVYSQYQEFPNARINILPQYDILATDIIEAVTFLRQKSMGIKLRGSRIRGGIHKAFEESSKYSGNNKLEMRVDEKYLGPIVMRLGDEGAIVGGHSSSIGAKLFQRIDRFKLLANEINPDKLKY